jgi:hypothetical protein
MTEKDDSNLVWTYSWTVPAGSPLPGSYDGEQAITITAKDKAGNEVIPGGRFNSFQPDPSGDGSAFMMIEVRKRRPNGEEFTEVRPVTEGRLSEDQGGKPLRLKPQDLANHFLSLRSLGEFGDANPEARQEMDDMVEAFNNSTDEVSYNKFIHDRQRQRAVASKDQARVEKINTKELEGARNTSASKAEKILNQLAPFNPEDFMEEGKLNPEGQKRAAARQQILQTIREDITGRPLEDLYNRPVDKYFEIPAIRQSIEQFFKAERTAIALLLDDEPRQPARGKQRLHGQLGRGIGGNQRIKHRAAGGGEDLGLILAIAGGVLGR